MFLIKKLIYHSRFLNFGHRDQVAWLILRSSSLFGEAVQEKTGTLPCQLVDTGRVRHGLFFAHLALEKSLKAVICERTQDLAPRLHNLSRLAELAVLAPDALKMEVLADMNAVHIEGRYPESLTKPPTKEEALIYLAEAEGIFQWLMNQS
jgi:HEPN domain-containing protein